ncbi:uncharacterized protein [Dermacentor albipictus]|uniref:uncharacterized protein n=1 Tax=Dermacentor albipictus TaxID=60249 RepID=UPI0038FCA027
MASGDLLLEVSDKKQYENLSGLVEINSTPVSINPHRSLNSTRGVVSEQDLLDLSETELLEGWKEQHVTNVQRIKIRRDDKEIPTKHLILTFCTSTLPEYIETGYMKIKLRPYIPNPRRCFKCQRFVHGSQSCRGRTTCAKCASNEHPADNCTKAHRCANCEGDHPAYSRSCPSWKKEKEIITLKIKENISFQEARKRISFLHTAGYAGAARRGAAPQQTGASARPTKSVATAVSSAPQATVASAAAPSLKEGPSTSGLVASKALLFEARPTLKTPRFSERKSSGSQESMDTTPSQKAHPAPREQRESRDRSKKDRTRTIITGPETAP